MKIRNGFVSNSSSSSFVINKRNLSKSQIRKIRDYEEEGKQYGLSCGSFDSWGISENSTWMAGSTSMDNFDMAAFFERIGVQSSEVKWGDGYEYDLLPEEDSPREEVEYYCPECEERLTTYYDKPAKVCPFCGSFEIRVQE
jgi:hypothetical protein